MSTRRLHIGPRMSQAVISGGTIYLAGQVGTPGSDITAHTQDCLANIDTLLAEAGSDRSKLLQITVWLADMADFDAMNSVYDSWVDPDAAPARACCEARLASPDYLVEIIAVAAH